MDVTDIGQENTPSETRRRVVVGVDGSPASIAALREARHFADLEGLPLQAITCWEIPPMYNGFAMLNYDEFREWAAEILRQAVTKAYGDDLPEDLRLTTIGGSVRESLLSLSRGARLLVLGTRGHGPFTGFLLGSVSAGCIARSTCPVLVVHPENNHPTNDSGE